MKKLSVIILALIMVFAMAACGGNSQNNGSSDNGQTSDAPQMTVVIDIDYPDASGIADVDDVKMQVVKGSSVLTVLNEYAAANNCEVVMSDTSSTAYVVSIGGLEATDTAGWVYEVNDQMIMESADVCILEDGDKVSWDFETWGE